MKEALVSYSYTVDGVPYIGIIPASRYGGEETVNQYPEGKTIDVYYSPKQPAFSMADKPPGHFNIISDALFRYLFVPLWLLNIPSMFFFWLSIVEV